MTNLRSLAISCFVVIFALFGMPSAAAEGPSATASGGPPPLVPAHLLTATNSGALFHAVRNVNGTWTPARDVKVPAGNPGYVTDTASAVINLYELHVVAVTDRGLFHTIRNTDGTWDPFRDVFSQTGNPGFVVNAAVANVGERLHVLVRTNTGSLFHTIRDYDGTWDPFRDVSSQTGGPGFVVDVAAADGGAGELHILVANNYGGLLHATRYNDGTWSRLGDVKSQTGDPGPVTRTSAADLMFGRELHILVSTANGGLFHAIRKLDGSWTGIGDVKSQTGNPGPVSDVTAAGVNEELQITVATNNGGEFHAIRNDDGTWTGMGNVKQVTGDPGPVTRVSIA